MRTRADRFSLSSSFFCRLSILAILHLSLTISSASRLRRRSRRHFRQSDLLKKCLHSRRFSVRSYQYATVCRRSSQTRRMWYFRTCTAQDGSVLHDVSFLLLLLSQARSIAGNRAPLKADHSRADMTVGGLSTSSTLQCLL